MKRMTIIKKGDYTGYSTLGIYEAIQNALEQAGPYDRMEIVETLASQGKSGHRQYQATLIVFNK